MKVYDVNVIWLRVSSRGRYSRGHRWHRGVVAASLGDAERAVLAHHTDKINPSVSLAWPVWPQPKEML